MAFQFSISLPAAGPYATGVKINNAGGYAAGTTAAMTVDGLNATQVFPVGSTIMARDNAQASTPMRVLGVVTHNGATNVRINGGGGTAFTLADDDVLYCLDVATLAWAKADAFAAGAGLPIAPTTTVQVSDDGRGNLIFVYADMN